MNRIAKIIMLIAALAISQVCHAIIRLPHIFQSHMVLQQKSQCPIWGWANPGEEVEVECSWGVTTKAVTGVNGRWEVTVVTPSYGGPYTVIFRGQNTIILDDVLIGDVYLCVGEVNMELPLHGMASDTVIGGRKAIAEAAQSDPNSIRVIGISQRISLREEEDVPAYWVKISDPTIEYMSAMAYFFAQKIHKETGVPIGIINPAWGGTRLESWINEEFLGNIPEFQNDIEQYKYAIPQQELLSKWVKSHDKVNINMGFNNMTFTDTECARMGYDDSKWPKMMIPCYYDNDNYVGTFDGAVWFRKWVDIPEEWQEKQLILSLGPIDDMDETFVNGELIGRSMGAGQYNIPRFYKIHPGLVRPGKMLIAVRMVDDGNAGGICGRPEQLMIYPENEVEKSISLAGEWTYQPVAELFDRQLYLYNYRKMEFNERPKINVSLSNKTIFSTYNAMLHPIAPYTIKAALWCQGESNLGLGKAEIYYKMLPQLAGCWRKIFRSPNMKFYYTQQYPYSYQNGTMSYELREAQRRAVAEIPNSGMVCMMDMGLKESLRTPDKKKEGERMALIALRELYGKNIEYSGPELASFTVNKSNNSIELSFTHTTGGLVAKGDGLKDFEISNNNGVFFPANAVIQGNKVIVSSPEVPKPKNVRYAWKEWIDQPSLYNGAGLPASSFSTEKSFMVDSETVIKANEQNK